MKSEKLKWQETNRIGNIKGQTVAWEGQSMVIDLLNITKVYCEMLSLVKHWSLEYSINFNHHGIIYYETKSYKEYFIDV